jgi:hypothetical protein
MTTAEPCATPQVPPMRNPMPLSERDLDRAILRNRIAYDRAECSPAWYEDEDLAAELASIEAEAHEWISDRTARLIAGLVLAAAVLGAVAVAVAYLELPKP